MMPPYCLRYFSPDFVVCVFFPSTLCVICLQYLDTKEKAGQTVVLVSFDVLFFTLSDARHPPYVSTLVPPRLFLSALFFVGSCVC